MAKKLEENGLSMDFVAFIGWDWGDQEHSVCLQQAGVKKIEKWRLEHTTADLTKWLVSLRERFGGGRVAVCVSRGPIVSVLTQYDFVTVFPVNPQTLPRYREAWAPSGAKDDPTDAQFALELVVSHREKLKPLMMEGADLRALRRLVEDRRRIVEQRVRHTNRLTAALKEYYPQVLSWFEDKGTLVFCRFLERWDSAEAAQKARRSTVEAFFKEHNVRSSARVEERIESMKQSVPLTTDSGEVLPAKVMVRALLPRIVAAIQAINEYDKQIAALESKLPSSRVFRSFPAAADAFAPRLVALFGEDRSRYASAAQVQRYCGVAPVTKRSGKQQIIHWRYRCPKFERQTLVERAGLTIPHSYWAEQFYRQQRERGAGHQAALRALAYKWVRVLYRCWQSGETYDESRYLKALNKRNAPLLEKSTGTS